jgi:hypothetical protein
VYFGWLPLQVEDTNVYTEKDNRKRLYQRSKSISKYILEYSPELLYALEVRFPVVDSIRPDSPVH